MTQRCGSCKGWLDETEFAPSQRGRNGFWCRACQRLQRQGARVSVPHQTRTCVWCGTDYAPVHGKNALMYCSIACKTDARALRQQATLLATKIARPCPVCGAAISPGRRSDVQYCTTRCAGLARVEDGRSAATHKRARLKRYGLTFESYADMVVAQGDKCAICGSSEKRGAGDRWHVDHCHKTGRTRGLLCGLCNTGIGQMQDDPARLRAAANYLERNSHG